MNDPWDVKSVRQSNQYLSCMKLNGVPLLPPVLSRECRKEMQYYKLLAKEVEKRISILHPYVNSDSGSYEDKTDAPELPDYEQISELPNNEIDPGNIEKTAAVISDKTIENPPVFAKSYTETSDESLASDITVKSTDTSFIDSPKLVIDLSLSNSQIGKNLLETITNVPECSKTPLSPPLELPERDCDYEKKPTKELLTDVDTIVSYKKKDVLEDVVFNRKLDDNCLSDPFPDIPLRSDGPSSLSSRSFTGSLQDIHAESAKELFPKLIRQHSYTILHPSPQLLAHLEVQSLNTGVEVTAISMSESLSNIHSPNKKRRSWDLESAKVKWSHMALELQRASIAGAVKTKPNVSNGNSNNVNNNNVNANTKISNNGQIHKQAWNTAPSKSPARARSVAPEQNTRRNSLNSKTLPKSEPIQRFKTMTITAKNIPSNRTIVKEPTSPKVINQHKDSAKHTPTVISKSDDPATRVRELYEKIQKQQLIQMANLVEKQKREQLLLQQVFEEQNNILFKQLKTICPKSPVEAKEAWCDKIEDRGPVSLSQLINNHQPSTQSACADPVNTLSETNGYISRCDNVLKKSRDITNNIKKQTPKSRSLNGSKIQTPQLQGNRTRTHSPTQKNTSRRLNYDSTNSSDREYEPMLTDRTNDTMADLNNITFPSDSDDCQGFLSPVANPSNIVANRNFISAVHTPSFRSTDSAIRTLEETIQNSMNTMNMICNNTIRMGKHDTSLRPPTAKELAAATRIVAHAKGYLVRRLMRTERVQETVQTIRDALLCALQLHRDREGIRGADVDLHRRLIQQITAACYSLHDAFVASSPAERCALIAADRARRRAAAAREPAHTARTVRRTDIMSQSCGGSLPARHHKRPSASLMTQSNYETYSAPRCAPSPRRRPWR